MPLCSALTLSLRVFSLCFSAVPFLLLSMDSSQQDSIPLKLKRSVPPDPTGAPRYIIIAPTVAREQQQPPVEDPNHISLDALSAYEFRIPDVRMGTRTFSVGTLVSIQPNLDTVTKFLVTRLFLCQILAGIIEIPDFLLRTRLLRSWLALRICESLGCVRETLVAVVSELLRLYSKPDITQIITKYLDLQYVPEDQEPQELFCSIIREVCGLAQKNDQNLIRLENIGTLNWRQKLATIHVKWLRDRSANPEQAERSTDREAWTPTELAPDTATPRSPSRKRKIQTPETELPKDAKAARNVLEAIQDIVLDLQEQLEKFEALFEAKEGDGTKAEDGYETKVNE